MKFNNNFYHFKKVYIFFIFLSLIIFFFSTTKFDSKAFEVDNIEEEKLLSQAQAEDEITRILQLEQAQETILNQLVKYETQAKENNLSEFNSYSLIKRDSSLLPDNLLNNLFSIDLNDPVFVSPQQNGDIYIARLTKIKNSKDLAKKEDIDAAKASLSSINARFYLDSIFKELEADSYIN